VGFLGLAICQVLKEVLHFWVFFASAGNLLAFWLAKFPIEYMMFSNLISDKDSIVLNYSDLKRTLDGILLIFSRFIE
jgi:hypothetical protein